MPTGPDCAAVLARLRALFGDVPVMIVIRKQEDLLFSTYVNSLRSGYFGSYADFVNGGAILGRGSDGIVLSRAA